MGTPSRAPDPGEIRNRLTNSVAAGFAEQLGGGLDTTKSILLDDCVVDVQGCRLSRKAMVRVSDRWQ